MGKDRLIILSFAFSSNWYVIFGKGVCILMISHCFWYFFANFFHGGFEMTFIFRLTTCFSIDLSTVCKSIFGISRRLNDAVDG